MADITKINLNGTAYTIVDSAATSGLSAEITRAQAAESANTAAIAAEVVARQSAITAVETVLSGKADQATTLSGYGITDAYTSAQTNTAIQNATSGLQTTLTAGTGIDITNNVISCTVDTGLYVVVQTLPAAPESGNENKIHLVPLPSTAASQNDEYEEYLWNADDNEWEYLGVKQIEIDLSDYWTSAQTTSQIASWFNDRVGAHLGDAAGTYPSVENVLESAGVISTQSGLVESHQVALEDDVEDAIGEDLYAAGTSIETILENAGIATITAGSVQVNDMQAQITAYYDSTTEALVLTIPGAGSNPNA